MASQFSLSFNEIVAVITLSQSLIFLLFLVLSHYRYSRSNQILAFLFFILATAKLDQIYQMQGGLEAFPQFAFVLVPLQLLIAPSLYFFVRSKVEPEFRLEVKHLLHFIPAVLLYCYYGAILIGRDPDEIRALMSSGVLSGTMDKIVIPSIGDLIQIGYILAALKGLQAAGVVFRNWFSGNEDEIISGLKAALLLWAFIFLTHLALILVSSVMQTAVYGRVIFEVMNLLHLGLVNTLMLVGIVSHLKWPSASATALVGEKYAASNASQQDRQSLFAKVQEAMVERKCYLNPNLTVKELADQVAATPRELSEAINGIGGKSFFEFVNTYRTEAAAKKLLTSEGRTILEIAMASGFNSKSSFNTIFKKQKGFTPTEFRKSVS